MLLLHAHLEERLGTRSARALRRVHAHKAHESAALVLGRVLHRLRLRADQVRRRHVGVTESGVALELLDHLLVLIGRLDGTDAKGDDRDAAQARPLRRQRLVERLRQLRGVAGQRAVADAHLGDLRESGLQRGQKLGLQLPVDLLAGEGLLHVAANVGVEEERVHDFVGVLAEAAHRDVHVKADIFVHHAEGHGVGRAVLVADDFLGVDEVHPLVLRRLAAEGEPVEHQGERLHDRFLVHVPVEDARLGGIVVHELARLGRDLHHLALVHDQHALPFVDRHDGTVGNDIIRRVLAAAETLVHPLDRLDGQHVRIQRLRVEVIAPLVREHARQRADSRP